MALIPADQALAPAVETRRLPGVERHVGISPLDVRQVKFAVAMRGFDRTEVSSFLLEVADCFDQAMRENERLRQDMARLEASLAQYRELETSLKSTLISAQKVADDMRDNAQKEAARIVREAEGHAELLLQKAQARFEDVQREIDGLRLKRREAEMGIEVTITALRNTLEFVREQDQREQTPKLAVHALQIVK
ncbi:MAG TPA: DivIVA domain-containing protein [Vicinamibacterales bacterium]|nr:DivIVA domain-containing protein [Vicinamibacterales bacterium]